MEDLQPKRTLVRVIPVAAERTNAPSGITVVTAVEVWTSMVVLRWVILDPMPSPEDPFPEGGWRLSDDAGTRYKMNEGGGGGSTTMVLGHTVFLPGVPPEAGRLLVDRPGLLRRIEVELV